MRGIVVVFVLAACGTSLAPTSVPPALTETDALAESSPKLRCGLDAAPPTAPWPARIGRPPRPVRSATEPPFFGHHRAELEVGDARWVIERTWGRSPEGSNVLDFLMASRTEPVAPTQVRTWLYWQDDPSRWSPDGIVRGVENGRLGEPVAITTRWLDAEGQPRREVTERGAETTVTEWLGPQPPFDAIRRRTRTAEGRVDERCQMTSWKLAPTEVYRDCVASRCPAPGELEPPRDAECHVFEYGAPGWVPRPAGRERQDPTWLGLSRHVYDGGREERYEWRRRSYGAELEVVSCANAWVPGTHCELESVRHIGFDGRTLELSEDGVRTTYCYELP
ncbi:MAG: hypothetical protein AAGH15_28030 [Myxococcota bacterium]